MHEQDPSAKNRHLEGNEFALDHFKVKLLTLQDSMKTVAGHRMAQTLSKFLEDFYLSIIEDQEIGNHSSGRYKIAQVYQEAGTNKSILFHPEEPFTDKKRPLEPNKYALDHLLMSRDEYIKKFLDQLKFELNGYR